ncbi:hypothetical protein RvVAT039_pl03550 (plasmid) [Agrobacterium vitis]|nr:hypothetical protein RvVAT039_pl03550 [Agrobacterium vitis]
MVQPPDKLKPFLNHSIASKPKMVLHAVLKDLKPPIFGMFLTSWGAPVSPGRFNREIGLQKAKAARLGSHFR